MDLLNSTNVSTSQSDFSVFTQQVLPSLYCIIFVVGVPLNVMAAWIFFRVPADSGLVVYLKNMVVADLLVLSTLPVRVVHGLGLGSWPLKVVTCRYTAPLFYSSMYVGIVFIGFISLERYVKVSRHSSSRRLLSWPLVLRSPRFARVLALLAWGLLLLAVLPNVVLTSRPASERTAGTCLRLKTPLGVRWHTASVYFNVSLFWLTLLVVVFCYASIARQVYQSYRRVRRDSGAVRRRTNRGIFSVLAVFFFCFVPYHVCRVPYTLSQLPASMFGPDARLALFQLKEATLFLSALNVCLDPVVYVLMCRTFRESLLRKLSGRRRKPLAAGPSLSNVCRERTDESPFTPP